MGSTLSAAVRSWQLILLFLLINQFSSAQDSTDYYKSAALRYDNSVYKSSVKTVKLERYDQPLTDPVIALNSEERLKLTFDDLGDDPGDYSYRYIHCTAAWLPDDLGESDYLNGFYNDRINTYRHSLSTLQPYLNYTLIFPGETMKPFISGNYLLVVYENNDPDKIVLTRRFWVTENRIDLQSRIHQATSIDQRTTHQEVDFEITNKDIPLANPYHDLIVKIVQNNRPDLEVSSLKPRFVNDKQLEYDYEDVNFFPGGNEFRMLDIRTLKFQTATVEHIERDSITAEPTIILKPDQRYSYQRYSSQDDINGRFLLKIYENREAATEGEYVNVKFRLPATMPFDSANVYVFGQLTDWKLDNSNRMIYSDTDHAYQLTLRLKQGYYNYQYLVQSLNGGPASAAETEGDHFETSNEYNFFVYWRDNSTRYDHLVGFRHVLSGGR